MAFPASRGRRLYEHIAPREPKPLGGRRRTGTVRCFQAQLTPRHQVRFNTPATGSSATLQPVTSSAFVPSERQELAIKARKGVVLATGGRHNKEMLKAYAPGGDVSRRRAARRNRRRHLDGQKWGLPCGQCIVLESSGLMAWARPTSSFMSTLSSSTRKGRGSSRKRLDGADAKTLKQPGVLPSWCLTPS